MAGSLQECSAVRTAAEEYFRLAYPGFRLSDFKANCSRECLKLYLTPTDLPRCPNCGKRCEKKHATLERWIRCAPRDGFSKVFLHLTVRRVRCSCGCCKMERIDWLDSGSRLSNKLIALVQADLRDGDTNSTVAKRYGIDWSTVKRLDKLQLEHAFPEVDLRNVENLMMDEFSIEKGHSYATIVMDADTHRALWVCKGKSGKAVKEFFELLRAQKADVGIKSVAMDMNACFPSLVKQYLPKAKIVYDLFHVLQMFNRDVLVAAKKACQDRVNNALDELNANADSLSDEERTARDLQRQKLKSSRSTLTSAQWVLIKPKDLLDGDAQDRLNTLRRDNQLLADLYPLADLLRNIWSTKDPSKAASLLYEARILLLAIARTHSFEPARSFAKTLSRRHEGIVHAGRFGYSSCPLEGANNAIKVLKRVAYGYRDFEYFKLKIYARLPGRKRNPFSFLTRARCVVKQGLKNCCFHTHS